MRVAIIGAGWYGCHIASAMLPLGFEVAVFEKNARPLDGASGNNQFRLHLGFHYARHHATRIQSRDGFNRFLERYPSLSREIPHNIYAVPRHDSLIDYDTYRIVMTSSGLDYTELTTAPVKIAGVEGMLNTRERVLLLERSRAYFCEKLASVLRLGEAATSISQSEDSVQVNGSTFDYLIDATWCHLHSPPIDLFYEPTLLGYFETSSDYPAVTFVDGPLCSVYPTDDPDIYTLSSVVHTPLMTCSSSGEAHSTINSLTTAEIHRKIDAMQDQISEYLPDFRDHFAFMGPQLAIKTKAVGRYDNRACAVYRDGRTFTVMSGKIDTIFFATERILSMLAAQPELDTPAEARGRLRDEILARKLA